MNHEPRQVEEEERGQGCGEAEDQDQGGGGDGIPEDEGLYSREDGPEDEVRARHIDEAAPDLDVRACARVVVVVLKRWTSFFEKHYTEDPVTDLLLQKVAIIHRNGHELKFQL